MGKKNSMAMRMEKAESKMPKNMQKRHEKMEGSKKSGSKRGGGY